MFALRVLATSAVPASAGGVVRKSPDAAAPRRPAPGGARRGDSPSRDKWNDAVLENGSAGRITKRAWERHLGRLRDPPAALEDVCVVVVGSKKAGNIGAIARAAASFECEDLRLVAPRVDPTSRSSLSSAKGAQHVVHGAGEYSSVAEAIADCDAAVAFHVWHDGLDVRSLEDVGSLLRAFPGGRMDASMDEDEDEDAGRDVVPPKEEDDADADAAGECEESCPLFLEPVPDEALEIKDEIPTGDAEGAEGAEGGAEGGAEDGAEVEHGWKRRVYTTSPRNQKNRGGGKLALVFGREVDGLTDEEVNLCDAACRIPTGRLIESLSVSHAAVIILSQYYQHRTAGATGGGPRLSELPVMAPAGTWAPPRRSDMYPE